MPKNRVGFCVKTLFSIVIPTFNLSDNILPCINSLLSQTIDHSRYELLFIDDCSNDDTVQQTFLATQGFLGQVKLLTTPKNGGPGIARDIGIAHAEGEWIIFVDGDDQVSARLLQKLEESINNHSAEDSGNSLDLVAYDWCFKTNSENVKPEGRRDIKQLLSKRQDRIKYYLSMGMDGSVIYTAIKKSVITNNNISFFGGLHEDIDYIFKIYCHTNEITYIDEPLYIKYDRPGSIVNSLEKKHIDGYLRSWNEVANYIESIKTEEWQIYKPYFLSGITGSLAILLIKIHQLSISSEYKLNFYKYLYNRYVFYYKEIIHDDKLPEKTIYDKLSTRYLNLMDLTSKIENVNACEIDSLICALTQKAA